MKKSDLIRYPRMPGEVRCRVCDLPFGEYLPSEVARHEEFHKDYLVALRRGLAPYREEEREHMKEYGMRAACSDDTDSDRVSGAEWWLEGKYNDYLFDAIYLGFEPRTLRSYYAKLVRRNRLPDFPPEVLEDLNRTYG